ncbi:MAG: DUF2891 domain-containing protein [Bacteroidia bacterium]|nr:DUF2891 domain-containing protein [Bacteroidia bacterium]
MKIALSCLFGFMMASMAAQDLPFLLKDGETGSLSLTEAGASHLAELAFRCVGQEYPNKISHVLDDSTDIGSPSALHPAFYGCFDWHSSVHGHWMLVRLLKEFPSLPEAAEIRAAIDENLQPDKILAEVAYLESKNRKSFERMYGWAWLLKLAEELHSWDDAQGQRWAGAVQPLADHIETLYIDFLPRQTYPIRTGEHPNTAFGLSFAWDYALAMNRTALQAAIREAAFRYYALDADCPGSYEPGGADFLSPCLEEANLMQRILTPEAFSEWFSRFLPTLPGSLRQPAVVSDRTDGKLVHLDGLNLSRAWCLMSIAAHLPETDPRKQALRQIAATHIEVTLPNIASGGYEGEHWLASFAVYALSVAGK